MPEDIIGPNELMDVARKSGLNPKAINKIFQDVGKFLKEKEDR
jgi:hypothetical protein